MYIPMKVLDVQSIKECQPNWFNENIYETKLQLMYGGTFNYPKRVM